MAAHGFDGRETELYIEPFLGWRGWKWDASRQRLLSMNNEVWEPGEELHAQCRAGIHSLDGILPHKAPDVECNCGIFSMKEPKWLENHVQVNDRRMVIGTVKIWGNVIGGSKGWRAEYAMIDSLYVPCSDAEIEQAQLMKFMYDVDGDKTPAYLRSAMADQIEEVYQVTVFRHDPRELTTVPENWNAR